MSLWWIVAVAVLAVWAWSAWRPDPVGLADRAVRTGDFAPVLGALHRVGAAAQPTEYHRVIKRLWNGYHREEAAVVARDYAARHKEAPTAQYWLQQLLQNEPEIAAKTLDEAFLQSFYVPSVAARCGSGGCSRC